MTGLVFPFCPGGVASRESGLGTYAGDLGWSRSRAKPGPRHLTAAKTLSHYGVANRGRIHKRKAAHHAANRVEINNGKAAP
jgi:hypothetical protein